VVVGLDLAEGLVTGGRIAIGCAYGTPVAAVLPFDRALSPDQLGDRAEAVAEAVVEGLPEPVTDHHAGARYRRRMIGLLLQRHLRSLA
jgi:CO/xanthine dehydrogenase FAD-binding subunit